MRSKKIFMSDDANYFLINEQTTPFEKSLAKRIIKARQILAIAYLQESYTSQSDLEAREALDNDLTELDKMDQLFFNNVNEYYKVCIMRKELFQGTDSSIKESALLMKNVICDNLTIMAYHRKEIKRLYGIIKSQNPLPPPIDFSVKSFDRDIVMFFQSYSVLLTHFKEMVYYLNNDSELSKLDGYSLELYVGLILNAEGLSKKIDDLLQKIYIVNEIRLNAYTIIRERCLAITSRFRHLYGSSDKLYREIIKFKL